MYLLLLVVHGSYILVQLIIYLGSKVLSSNNPCVGNKKIKIVDGYLSTIASKGPIAISKFLILHNVIHFPNLSCNLSSVSKLTCDLKCCATFFVTCYEFLGNGLGENNWQCKRK